MSLSGCHFPPENTSPNSSHSSLLKPLARSLRGRGVAVNSSRSEHAVVSGSKHTFALNLGLKVDTVLYLQ